MEKVYKTMNSAGKFNLTAGILTAAAGMYLCISGAFMIVHAVKLHSQKKNILF